MIGKNSCPEVERQKNITQARNTGGGKKNRNLENKQEAPHHQQEQSHPCFQGETGVVGSGAEYIIGHSP